MWGPMENIVGWVKMFTGKVCFSEMIYETKSRHRQLVRQGHSGAYIEDTGNQPGGGGLGTEGTDNNTDRGAHSWAHWSTVNCTYRGHRQPVRQGPTGALCVEHAECTGNQPGEGRLVIEGTDNKTDRGHPQWDTLWHCRRGWL